MRVGCKIIVILLIIIISGCVAPKKTSKSKFGITGNPKQRV